MLRRSRRAPRHRATPAPPPTGRHWEPWKAWKRLHCSTLAATTRHTQTHTSAPLRQKTRPRARPRAHQQTRTLAPRMALRGAQGGRARARSGDAPARVRGRGRRRAPCATPACRERGPQPARGASRVGEIRPAPLDSAKKLCHAEGGTGGAESGSGAVRGEKARHTAHRRRRSTAHPGPRGATDACPSAAAVFLRHRLAVAVDFPQSRSLVVVHCLLCTPNLQQE